MNVFEIEVFLLVLTRIASFLVSSPIFSITGIPTMLKIGFSFLLTIIVMFIHPNMNIEVANAIGFYVLLIKEAAVGLFMGYITDLVFKAVQTGGQITDRQAGFAMAESFDPMTKARSSVYGRMYNWLAISMFLLLDAHHHLIQGIISSFKWAPVGQASITHIHIADVVYLFTRSFLTAFQIGIPIIIVIFMCDVIMGMIARTVPQLNVFILGMPLKVMAGMMAFLVLIMTLSNMMVPVIEEVILAMDRLVQLL